MRPSSAPRDSIGERVMPPPRDAADLGDENADHNRFLERDEQVLPNIHIPGFHTRWMRVSVEGKDDGSNVLRRIRGKMQYTYVRPDEVPDEYKIMQVNHPAMGGNVLQYRDCVLVKTSEKLASQYREAMQILSQRQAAHLRRETQDRQPHKASRFQVEDDTEQRGSYRAPKIDES